LPPAPLAGPAPALDPVAAPLPDVVAPAPLLAALLPPVPAAIPVAPVAEPVTLEPVSSPLPEHAPAAKEATAAAIRSKLRARQ
jgi:hypothetical protein